MCLVYSTGAPTNNNRENNQMFVVTLAEDIDRDEVPMLCKMLYNKLLDVGVMVDRVEWVED